MTEDNVIGFAQPQNDLDIEQRMVAVARLADDVAVVLDTGGSLMGMRELLERIEQATAKLREISDLMMRGAERARMEEACRNVLSSVDRVRQKLDDIDSLRSQP